MTGLDLQIADRARPLFGTRTLHALFESAQLLPGLGATRAGLPWILTPQIAGGIAHLFRNLAQLLLLGLFGQGVGLPAQFFLVARQTLELTLCFFGCELRLVRREVTLLFRQRFLPARQLPDRRERVVLALLRCGVVLRGALLLVISLLFLAQLLIEQRREIRLFAITVAAATAARLLHRHLPPADFRGSLQQLRERLLFKGQRRCHTQLIELCGRAPHRVDRLRHGIVTGSRQDATLWTLPATLPGVGAGHCRCHLGGLVLQSLLRLRDRLDVRRGLRARATAARPGVELPRRRHDVFLLGDQLLEAGLRLPLCAGLPFRCHELLLVGLDLEKENVAARFRGSPAATHIRRARVIRDDVTRLDVEIFQEHRMRPHHHRLALSADGEDFLFSARRLDHQLQRSHAVVVVGARLDRHFLERRNFLIAGRPQDADVGRPIGQHPDEIFSVAVVRQAVHVIERDPVRPVLRDDEVGHQHLVVSRQCNGVAVRQSQLSACHRLVGRDRELDPGARGRINIAAIRVGVGLQA